MTTRNAILAIAFATLATACGEKEAPSDFCPTALCGPGTVCDERAGQVCSGFGLLPDGPVWSGHRVR